MKLGDLLIEKGFITKEELSIALSVQKITGHVFGRCLVMLGFISTQELAEVLAIQHGLEYVDIRNYPIQPELLQEFPKSLTETARFIPLEERDGIVKVAVVDPSNIVAIDRVKVITGKKAKSYLTDEEGFTETIEKVYYFLENPAERVINEVNETILTTGMFPPERLPRLVDSILTEGIRRNATDIHISINAGVVGISYRVDGILHYAFSLSRVIYNSIISRIKILSRLDIAEQRLPQDGSFVFSFLDRKYEIRVSIIPTVEGESMVLRILLGGFEQVYSLQRLGFNEELLELLKSLINKMHGMILIVGPTGSGKSTTLYSLLRQVNRLRRCVITIEDPVEYKISFAKQSEINEKTGYDFALAGRNFMRHDPDIILLGEIRDEETALIAIRASLTGHLVLSTLHTKDAASAVPRLFDLGIDKFLLSSSLLAVLSQRLIRKICPYCKEERHLNEKEKAVFNSFDLKAEKVYYGRGCRICTNTGYLGRTAIGELMIVNEEIRDMIYTGASFNALVDAAKKNGMIPLKIDGLRKVIDGISTLSEVERVAG